MRRPKTSPWGKVVNARELADGIWWVATDTHGGLKLSKARLEEMPKAERTKDGWYEEDREAAFPYRRFVDAGVLRMSIDQLAALDEWYESIMRHTKGFKDIRVKR